MGGREGREDGGTHGRRQTRRLPSTRFQEVEHNLRGCGIRIRALLQPLPKENPPGIALCVLVAQRAMLRVRYEGSLVWLKPPFWTCQGSCPLPIHACPNPCATAPPRWDVADGPCGASYDSAPRCVLHSSPTSPQCGNRVAGSAIDSADCIHPLPVLPGGLTPVPCTSSSTDRPARLVLSPPSLFLPYLQPCRHWQSSSIACSAAASPL